MGIAKANKKEKQKEQKCKKKTNEERLIARQTFLCGHFDSVELSQKINSNMDLNS